MHDAIVVGAGPAGLATSHELSRRRIGHIVLERGSRIGQTWENLYDSLVLHTGKHLSALPGLPFPRSTSLFPSRGEFLEYLNRYAEKFGLPVKSEAHVVALGRENKQWFVNMARGPDLRTRSVVIATGIVSNPHIANIPGRDRFHGLVMHSGEYRRPDAFTSQRVLVVGIGNSAGEIAAELARAGALVTIAVRSGARVVPRQLLGIPIQYFAVLLGRLPRDVQRGITEAMSRGSALLRGPTVLPRSRSSRCADVPLIGFHLVDALRARTIRLKGGISEFTKAGARFADSTEEVFDRIILATGYKAAVGLLGDQIQLDACGFANRRARVVSCDQPDLYFVGHTYDTRGALRNIAYDAKLAAGMIAAGNTQPPTPNSQSELFDTPA